MRAECLLGPLRRTFPFADKPSDCPKPRTVLEKSHSPEGRWKRLSNTEPGPENNDLDVLGHWFITQYSTGVGECDGKSRTVLMAIHTWAIFPLANWAFPASLFWVDFLADFVPWNGTTTLSRSSLTVLSPATNFTLASNDRHSLNRVLWTRQK